MNTELTTKKKYAWDLVRSYPGPKAAQINFTIFAHGKPWGRSITITKLSQLVKLLSELADFVEPDKKKRDDDE